MSTSVFTHLFSSSPTTILLKPRQKPNASTITTRTTRSSSIQASFSDPFVLQLAESIEDSLPSASPIQPLQQIRDTSSLSLLSTPWPSRRDELFRFTDTSFIRNSQIQPISEPPPMSELPDVLEETQLPTIVIADGFVLNSLSNVTDLPDGVYAGSLSSLPEEILVRVSDLLTSDFEYGDLFWSINGIGAPDVTVIYVPEGCKVENPIHLRYFSVEGGNKGSKGLSVSNPRVFVLVEKEGEVSVVEDFVGREGNEFYWANAVLEVFVGEGGKVNHSYLQRQSSSAAHVKWTSVRQEPLSTYELVEVSTGGKLGRHNLHVQQLGPDTVTKLTTFHLCIGDQTQDLHSRIVLDHPRGVTRQLHKCIVGHSSGQAVFDGNVKVNKYAQQTDAGQLTRSLLLEPRATVNLKPNLQIIANDVKCSHGAAISDLDKSQLFYLQARGIDIKTARRALISSFGAEVIDRFLHPCIQNQVKNHIQELLQSTTKNLP